MKHIHRQVRSSLLVAMLVLAGAFADTATYAQSDNDLRRENQRLNTQLLESARELEAAKARIAELEAQVQRLEQAIALLRGGDRPTAPAVEDEKVTIDETEPSASPRALYRALVNDYREAVEGLEIGAEGDRTRTLYMRTLRRWQAATARKFRAQVQWHVQIKDETTTRSGYNLQMQAVDPVTHTELGDAFVISLPRAMARRYETLRDRGEANVLVLRGTLVPQVVINSDRHESGPFDNPPLIGPFAEFRFTIEPRSLMAATDEE